MDRAKLVLFEDLAYRQRQVQQIFEGTGHELVATASTLDESLSVVDQIAAGELEADVIILDGHLHPSTKNGGDAKIIRGAIDRHELGVKVVGFSACDGMEISYGVKVDADSYKSVEALPRIIDDLER